MPKPQVVQPKTPIAAMSPPSNPSVAPPGASSLLSTTAALRKKPAFTMKSSLLG